MRATQDSIKNKSYLYSPKYVKYKDKKINDYKGNYNSQMNDYNNYKRDRFRKSEITSFEYKRKDI